MVGRTPKERVSFLLYTKKWLKRLPRSVKKKVKERDDICLGSRGWLKKKRGGGGVSKKRKVIENPIIEQKKKRVTFHARTRKNNNSKTNVCLIVDCCDSRGASFDSSFARCRRSISILRVASRGPRGGFECLSLSSYIFFLGARKDTLRSFSLLFVRLDFECDFGFVCPRSRARSLGSLDPSLPPSLSLRNARSRLKRPLRHPFHAVRAKSLLLQIRKLQICIVGCCQSRERIVVPGGDSPGVLGWLHGG